MFLFTCFYSFLAFFYKKGKESEKKRQTPANLVSADRS
jgi:hypothetical protein